ncbi:MAG TPA: DsbA family protein [Acetobacteraceae bacterium]|nr:DsbA family protein [Acetobacteraceae bacterium]
MLLSRRVLLSVVAASAALGSAARAAEIDPESPRPVGNPDAKVTVEEWFSLTCTHCADFAKETFPEIKAKLIDTGKVRWVFRDFPLDQVALLAAQVAHYLPPDRYEPFVLALFASQDRWAFAQGVNTTDELWKMAALAGMNKADFDKAIADTKLRNWILQEQSVAQKKFGIDSTPSFVIGGKVYPGEMPYDAFVKLLPGT